MKTFHRFTANIRRGAVLGSLSLIAVAIAIASGVLLRASGVGAVDPGPPVQEWPAFQMTYSEYEADAATGAVLLDRTHQLVVSNDLTWRDEVTRDAVDPQEVGSYRELRDGVYTTYSAKIRHSTTNVTPGTVGITPELMPTLYAMVRAGRYLGQGFSPVEAQPGRYAAVRIQDDAREHIEFDTAHINDKVHAGITISAERVVGGKVVRRFKADSLTVQP